MASRCLNKVSLIGNLTRDPELKYTPAGMAVISFGLATNRSWTTRDGERKEAAQFHRIVAWNKLAELCSQLLAKGRRVFVEGRLQYREYADAEGHQRQVTEIVIDDMILLDNKRMDGAQVATGGGEGDMSEETTTSVDDGTIEDIIIPDDMEVGETVAKADKVEAKKEEVNDEEMPF
jgi:single-strand DNA-binding protein